MGVLITCSDAPSHAFRLAALFNAVKMKSRKDEANERNADRRRNDVIFCTIAGYV